MISSIYLHWRRYWLKLFNETFLVKGKSEILKYFFLYEYDVIILKWNTCVISSDPPFIEWHVRCTFETFISPSFLKQEMHESLLYRNHKKIFSFQNGKYGCLNSLLRTHLLVPACQVNTVGRGQAWKSVKIQWKNFTIKSTSMHAMLLRKMKKW